MPSQLVNTIISKATPAVMLYYEIWHILVEIFSFLRHGLLLATITDINAREAAGKSKYVTFCIYNQRYTDCTINLI